MKLLLSIIFLLFSFYLPAQDTLTVMHYNLLFYGCNESGCNSSNNNMNDKDNYLKKIIPYVKPDIFTVNEINCNEAIVQRILDNVLNINWITYYKRANLNCYSPHQLANMLYYNSKKLTLKSQSVVETNVRDINIYKLYYNSSDLPYTNDTAFVICIVAHLKAGSDSDDLAERADETNRLMNHLNNIGVADNYVFMSDFNIRSSFEESFQNIINYANAAIRFYDPIDKPGDWHNNTSFTDYHTQSTHTNGGNCPVGGGMDDRFDFIMISNNIKNGLDNVEYINGSYWAVGEDGQHFNKAINSLPTNTSVPADILDALYNMSDHLPVIMDVKVDKTLSIKETGKNYFADVRYNNPVKDKLNLSFKTINNCQNIKIEIISIIGQKIFKNDFEVSHGSINFSIPLEHIKKGIYLLKIYDSKGNSFVGKFIKHD
jgi:hypothetical protein